MSEFGKGQVYCLGLFLAHAERTRLKIPDLNSKMGFDYDTEVWFNAASDHLYELETKHKDKRIEKRLEELQKKVLHWGHGFDEKDHATEESRTWAIQEAKDLLMLIDEANGVETEKGDFE